ncbi:hypothetical protein O1Q82_01097 [Lonepinella sp. MS14437]
MLIREKGSLVKSYLFFGGLCLALTSCSGLQSHNLPSAGSYRTDQGSQVNIVPITQENIASLSQQNNAQQNAQQKKVLHLFQHNQTTTYYLQPYDVLSIQMWAYPEITPPATQQVNSDISVKASGYQIGADGYIELPLVGRYQAAGKSVEQITQGLRSQFSRYLKQPDPIVRVLSYEGSHYSVQGNVAQIGQFPLGNQPVSVYAALGLAGGLNDLGDPSTITLIRDGVSYTLNPISLEKSGYSLHNLLLKPNDTLYVGEKDSQKIYVMGEANKSQAYNLREEGMTLSDVLGESAGIDMTSASAKGVYVLRSNQNHQETEIYVMDLSNIGNFGLANQFTMQRNDIVYIDATGLTRWQRIVNQILPFSNTVYNFSK